VSSLTLKRLAMRIFFVIEVIVVLLWYFFGKNGIQSMMKLQYEQQLLEREKMSFCQEVTDLQKKIDEWKVTPFLKEKVAREQLQMAREGEEIYYVDSENKGDNSMSYPYKLPELPYAHDALEPYIDERTMHFHHDKHQRGYMIKLNEALSEWPEGQNRDLVEMLSHPDQIPQHLRKKIVDNGGGYWIHTLYWNNMEPAGGGDPTGKLAEAIEKSFGSIAAFKDLFSAQARSFFGSGWVWLVITPEGNLKVSSSVGHELPQKEDNIPLLVIDVWEHAYYLKFQNRRAEYIENWWQVVNWPEVEKRLLAQL